MAEKWTPSSINAAWMFPLMEPTWSKATGDGRDIFPGFCWWKPLCMHCYGAALSLRLAAALGCVHGASWPQACPMPWFCSGFSFGPGETRFIHISVIRAEGLSEPCPVRLRAPSLRRIKKKHWWRMLLTTEAVPASRPSPERPQCC